MDYKSNDEQVFVDERRVALAAAFLDGKDYAVYKTTRAGFTTSFVIAAERSGKRVLLVSPTKKIISSTMNGAAEIVGIYGNSACEYNKREILKYPFLKHLPMSLPPKEKCHRCKFAEECCILDIERDPDAPMKSLTAAKLIAILMSDSERSQYLRSVLCDIDIVMLDEAHTLVASDVPKIPCEGRTFTALYEKLDGFPALHLAIKGWWRLLNVINPSEDYNAYDDLQQEVDALGIEGWLVREVTLPTRAASEFQRKMHGELKKVAKQHDFLGVTEQEVILLRDLIDILGNNTIRLSYITSNGEGKIYVCGGMGRGNAAIQEYLRDYARVAVAIFVSGTLYEPLDGYFNRLVGRKVEQGIFPDLYDTNSKMIVYTDTKRLSGETKHKLTRLPEIVARIKEISESKKNVAIHLLAPNIDIRTRLHEALHKDYPNILCDYYRSADTIGVESGTRTIIAVGLAEVPKNAYDCLSNSYNESQSIRVNDVDAASWQALSRAKDPRAEEPSEVYCIGVKAEDADRVITWGTNRKITRIGKYRYGVTCDRELPKPVVMVPFKQQVHSEQRKSSPFIKKIWDVEEDLSSFPDGLKVYEVEIPIPKNSKSTYIDIRDFGENRDLAYKKVRCFGALFSRPQNSEQLAIMTETLDRFFRSKHTHHAVQRKYANSRGSFPYRPCATEDWDELIFDMLCGLVTVATYPIGEDGLTVQCTFDLDNHKGDNPSLPRVTAILDHVKNMGMQPILIASGSPDSYHIHLPILRIAIETSHNFVNTLHHELKQAHKELDFKKDTESFPKQKTKKAPFGNALKLPLAMNNKTGKCSQLLDPNTNEPVDFIFITRVIELREPEEEAVRVAARQYLPATLPARGKSAEQPEGRTGTMRHCMLEALNKQLKGSEGNDMRVAVVCEALASGKSRDEITHLFECQDDFDKTITAKYVDYIIAKEYHPWKCETLHDRCSTFVNCDNCSLRRDGSLAEQATAR
jgi:hypothetical protein